MVGGDETPLGGETFLGDDKNPGRAYTLGRGVGRLDSQDVLGSGRNRVRRQRNDPRLLLLVMAYDNPHLLHLMMAYDNPHLLHLVMAWERSKEKSGHHCREMRKVW